MSAGSWPGTERLILRSTTRLSSASCGICGERTSVLTRLAGGERARVRAASLSGIVFRSLCTCCASSASPASSPSSSSSGYMVSSQNIGAFGLRGRDTRACGGNGDRDGGFGEAVATAAPADPLGDREKPREETPGETGPLALPVLSLGE